MVIVIIITIIISIIVIIVNITMMITMITMILMIMVMIITITMMLLWLSQLLWWPWLRCWFLRGPDWLKPTVQWDGFQFSRFGPLLPISDFLSLIIFLFKFCPFLFGCFFRVLYISYPFCLVGTPFFLFFCTERKPSLNWSIYHLQAKKRQVQCYR